jgi:glycosyltransferase involved in cell wall biosynthesis
MRVALVGHTEHSLTIHPAGFGEITDTTILATYLREHGCQVTIHDAYHLLDHPKYDAADLTIFLTFPSLLEKLLALPKQAPIVSRLYAFDDTSHIYPHLHSQADATIVTNPIAFHLAAQQGVPLDQLIYLPMKQLPEPCHAPTDLVGCVTRLRYGKHVDVAIETAGKLGLKILVKGQLDPSGDIGDGAGHTARLAEMLKRPHVIWDQARTAHSEMPQLYSTFRASLLLSSFEDPCNIAIEQLACGVPMLLLDGEPRRTLYNDLAHFAPHQGEARTLSSYARLYQPAQAEEALATLLTAEPPDRELLVHRFGSHITRARLPLLWSEEGRTQAMQEDCARFGIAPPTPNWHLPELVLQTSILYGSFTKK